MVSMKLEVPRVMAGSPNLAVVILTVCSKSMNPCRCFSSDNEMNEDSGHDLFFTRSNKRTGLDGFMAFPLFPKYS